MDIFKTNLDGFVLPDKHLAFHREWTSELSYVTSSRQLQRKLDANQPLADFVRLGECLMFFCKSQHLYNNSGRS